MAYMRRDRASRMSHTSSESPQETAPATSLSDHTPARTPARVAGQRAVARISRNGHYGRYARVGGLFLLEFGLLALTLIVVRRLSVAIWRLPNGDVFEYHAYALAFWTQYPIMRSFPVEYPPLAIVPFSLTLVPSLTDYQSVFTYW